MSQIKGNTKGMMGAAKLRSGTTLIEMAIALSMLSGILLVTIGVLRASNASYSKTIAQTRVDEEARRLVQKVGQEIAFAGITCDSWNFADAVPLNTITFTRCIGYDTHTDSIIWGPAIYYEMRLASGEYLNGYDDNGNGLADEEILVRREGAGEEVIMGGNIIGSESSFSRQSTRVTIAITVGQKDPNRAGQIVRGSYSTDVFVRN